jgi:colanic acid/amylovoran biosynthesis protein
LLRDLGVKVPIITTACPAFLLKPAPNSRVKEIMQLEGIGGSSKPIIGITLAGYNLYSKQTWDVPETLEDLALYIPAVRFLLDELDAQVVLIPHVYRTNPWTGQLIQGPDYVILKTLNQMVCKDSGTQKLRIVEGTYSPAEVKGLIGKLDLYISGRLHAGVAAFSQQVPTVLLAYGHKHFGFAKMLGQERCVWQPSMGPDGLLAVVRQAWEDRENIVAELHKRVPFVKELAELNVKILRDIVSLDEESVVRFSKTLVDRWKSMGWEDR